MPCHAYSGVMVRRTASQPDSYDDSAGSLMHGGPCDHLTVDGVPDHRRGWLSSSHLLVLFRRSPYYRHCVRRSIGGKRINAIASVSDARPVTTGARVTIFDRHPILGSLPSHRRLDRRRRPVPPRAGPTGLVVDVCTQRRSTDGPVTGRCEGNPNPKTMK